MISLCRATKEKLDFVISNKGVAISETGFEYELENTNIITVKGKIKYETLYEKKENILDFAFKQLEKVVGNYLNSELYYKSLCNLVHVSLLMNYEKDETKYLKIILKSDVNVRENNGLMANPYVDFKNEVSNRLTEIHIKNKEFETMLNI